jgi:hypothetical protein
MAASRVSLLGYGFGCLSRPVPDSVDISPSQGRRRGVPTAEENTPSHAFAMDSGVFSSTLNHPTAFAALKECSDVGGQLVDCRLAGFERAPGDVRRDHEVVARVVE